jgi:hypothetical protein
MVHVSEFDPSAFLDGDEVVASLTDLGALADPIRIAGGWFTPPDRLGHGILFGRAALAAAAIAHCCEPLGLCPAERGQRGQLGSGLRSGVPQKAGRRLLRASPMRDQIGPLR